MQPQALSHARSMPILYIYIYDMICVCADVGSKPFVVVHIGVNSLDSGYTCCMQLDQREHAVGYNVCLFPSRTMLACPSCTF